MDILTQLFNLIVQFWDGLLNGAASIIPWLRATFPLATWFKGILDWLGSLKLPF